MVVRPDHRQYRDFPLQSQWEKLVHGYYTAHGYKLRFCKTEKLNREAR